VTDVPSQSGGLVSVTFTVPSSARVGDDRALVVTPFGSAASVISQISIVAPRITGVQPDVWRMGTTVTIGGSGFGAVSGAVFLAPAGATQQETEAHVTEWSDDAVKFVVPNSYLALAAQGPTQLTVRVKSGGSDLASISYVISTVSPKIADVSPTSWAPRSIVSITGTGFGTRGSNYVLVTGDSGDEHRVKASIVAWQDTLVQFAVPEALAGLAGPTRVTVRLVADASTQLDVVYNLVVTLPSVSILAVVPSSVPSRIGPGQQFVLTGSGFSGDTVLHLGSARLRIVSFTATTIVATLDEALDAGEEASALPVIVSRDQWSPAATTLAVQR
jgi:hypothetical protein